MRAEKVRRASYTLEYKSEAVRLVQGGQSCAGISVKYAWIERHKSCWPVTRQCEVLNVSTSGYFGHQRRRIADDPAIPGKRLSDAALLVHIKAVHAASKGE